MLYFLIVAWVLMIAGWVFQISKTLINKDFELSPILVILYGAACVIFTVNNFLDNDLTPGILNIISIILLAIILMGLLKTKRVQ